jgi:hypothetical protein
MLGNLGFGNLDTFVSNFPPLKKIQFYLIQQEERCLESKDKGTKASFLLSGSETWLVFVRISPYFADVRARDVCFVCGQGVI